MVPSLSVDVQITDREFVGLVCGDERLFALRQRAEEYASDLRSRVATVATDLRRMIEAETVHEPLAVMRVADHLDYLARELESEIGKLPPLEPPPGRRRGPDNVTFLRYGDRYSGAV